MPVDPHRVTAEHVRALAVADRMRGRRTYLVDSDEGIGPAVMKAANVHSEQQAAKVQAAGANSDADLGCGSRPYRWHRLLTTTPVQPAER